MAEAAPRPRWTHPPPGKLPRSQRPGAQRWHLLHCTAGAASCSQAEAAIESGTWFDVSAGKVTFRTYALDAWWASLHLELTTKAAYRSNLETHFLPFFGDLRMANILPSHVQAWVNQALEGGHTPPRVVKYLVVLHGIFKQAVRDRFIPFDPAAETKLPWVVRTQRRILTPWSSRPSWSTSPTGGCPCSSPASRPACQGRARRPAQLAERPADRPQGLPEGRRTKDAGASSRLHAS